MFQPGGVGHVARYVVRLQLKRVRGAGGEAPCEGAKQFVQFTLPIGVPPSTQDTHRFVTGPKCPPGRGIAIVQCQFRLVQVGF